MKKISINDFPEGFDESIKNNDTQIKKGEKVIDAFIKNEIKELYIDALNSNDRDLNVWYLHRFIFLYKLLDFGCELKIMNESLEKSAFNFAEIKNKITNAEDGFIKCVDENDNTKGRISQNIKAIASTKDIFDTLVKPKSANDIFQKRKTSHPYINFPKNGLCSDWMAYWYLMLQYLIKEKGVVVYVPNSDIKNKKTSYSEKSGMTNAEIKQNIRETNKEYLRSGNSSKVHMKLNS